MSVTVTKDFDLGKINLDLHKELNLCGEIIKKDHYQRLEKGQGVDGSQMKALSPNTEASKGSSKILVKSGKMRKLLIEKASKSNQQVVLHPERKQKYKGTNVTMSDVGGYHQSGTSPYKIVPIKAKKLSFKTANGWVHTDKVNHPGLPKREWFGISEKTEKKCVDLIEMRIEKELNRA